MTAYDHGPRETYEIGWQSGHIEHIQAHQVLMPPDDIPRSFGGGVYQSAGGARKPRRGWAFHGQIDGKWRLVLAADGEDIRSVRNLAYAPDSAPHGEADQ